MYILKKKKNSCEIRSTTVHMNCQPLNVKNQLEPERQGDAALHAVSPASALRKNKVAQSQIRKVKQVYVECQTPNIKHPGIKYQGMLTPNIKTSNTRYQAWSTTIPEIHQNLNLNLPSPTGKAPMYRNLGWEHHHVYRLPSNQFVLDLTVDWPLNSESARLTNRSTQQDRQRYQSHQL